MPNLPTTTSKLTNIRTPPKPISAAYAPPLDPVVITNLILKSDNPESLTQTVHTLSGWTPNLVQTILKRLWNHGPKALQFFNLIENHPSYCHSAAAFDHAIDIAARLRDYKTIWTLVCRMRSRKLGPTQKLLRLLLNGMYLLEKLIRLLRGRFRADVISYNIIANGFCLKKQIPRALEVMKEMVERGLEPTLTTYNILLKGYFRAGQITEGWVFFLEMKKRKIDIDVVSYTTVVHSFGVAGEVEKARKVFDEMIGAGVLPSVATYNALIQVLCKKDCVENAVLMFEEMLRKGYVPNTTTYNVLIRGLCHAGKMDMAIEYMDKMKDDCDPTIQTYNVVIRYYCDDGEIEKALVVFEKMSGETCLPNLDTYNVLISAMFVRKKSDDLLIAGKLLIEMVDRGFLPRKFTFNRVLNGLMLTGMLLPGVIYLVYISPGESHVSTEVVLSAIGISFMKFQLGSWLATSELRNLMIYASRDNATNQNEALKITVQPGEPQLQAFSMFSSDKPSGSVENDWTIV
ncbi:UNVERIFIED_CONTAM: Pentatricopeptide repeat-containing protein, mitochondrial [Sesamum latifolium]|uniref:Pentatricopeptide repeat-containing protein, mitochondrial n=1 Tax=Sesamum latifolium TaxID=2727402 RepID=A0AAW2TPY5_9LAMI